MDLPSKAIVDVLTYLLPGFLTAAIAYNLTPAPRPIPFERVVQALMFTIFVQVFVIGVKAAAFWMGKRVGATGVWTDDSQLIWSVVVAVLLGLAVAYLANTDRLHSVLRSLGITKQTSYSSEWYGAFSQNRSFVVLHLSGQRRLYGWPEEWPSTPEKGHFVVSMAEWLDDGKRIELPSVEKVIVRAADVEMVELMQLPARIQPEETNGRSQGTNPTTVPTASGSA
jgi:small-conductance mechanosensitive channel